MMAIDRYIEKEMYWGEVAVMIRKPLGLLIVGILLTVTVGDSVSAHTSTTTSYVSGFTNSVTITTDDSYRYIVSNGIPAHTVGTFPNVACPNTIVSQSQSYRVPLTGVQASSVSAVGNNEFGIALNGVLLDPAAAEYWNDDSTSGWQYNALSDLVDLGMDYNHAHVQPTGTYHYHGMPEGYIGTQSGASHSAIIGWAGDGFPIYARYGYTTATNSSSAIKELTTSYSIKSGTRASGPGGAYDGTYDEDYEYVSGQGDLDECNGRFSVTPEYPAGTYAYFVTDDYPYIPRYFRGTKDATFSASTTTTTCAYSLDASSATAVSSASTGTVAVTPSPTNCAWAATANPTWLSISSGASGTGGGTVTYAVSANSLSSSRSGTMSIAEITYTVTQAGVTCAYSLGSTSSTVVAAGATKTVAVTASATDCDWTASSASSWITINSATGTGSGTVSYTVAENTSSEDRTGVMTIAGVSYTVTQKGVTCAYTVDPTSAAATSSGGSGTVTVTTNATDCDWTATSAPAWITISSGASGAGSGSVAYTVNATTSSIDRTGYMTIAGTKVGITQSGVTCAFTLGATSATVVVAGATKNVVVTSSTGCPWTATTDESWITINSATGTGSGSVSYTVSTNSTGAVRTGTMTIAGNTFTVTQRRQ